MSNETPAECKQAHDAPKQPEELEEAQEDDAIEVDTEESSGVVGKRPFDSQDVEVEVLEEQRRKWKLVEGRRKRLNPPPRIPPDDRRRGTPQ